MYASFSIGFSGDRSFCTAIYYLLDGTDFNALHRLKQDELWHAYAGAPLTIHMIDPTGSYSSTKLGKNIDAGETLLAVAKSGWLFGANVDDMDSYALVGFTAAPGLELAGFEIPGHKQLLWQYPQLRHIIGKLTR